MSQINRFGADQIGYTHKTTHFSETNMSLGLGVSVMGNDTVVLANGTNLYGVVQSSLKLDDNLYKITVCTQAERIAVRLKDGEVVSDGGALDFSNGEAVKAASDSTSNIFLQEIDEAYFIEDGVTTKRAAQIKLV